MHARRGIAIGIGQVRQRAAYHARPQVGAADADIDDIGNALARGTLPGAAAHTLREIAHAYQHLLDCRHDLLAVNLVAGAGGRAQRYVQGRAVFRRIDMLARKHRVAASGHAGLGCQLHQQAHGFGRDPVLRIVEIKPGGFQRELRDALRAFAVEPLAHLSVAKGVMVPQQGVPGVKVGGHAGLGSLQGCECARRRRLAKYIACAAALLPLGVSNC
ncbi:hypothetical protein D9M72_386700 [compost metagenome]